MTSKITDRDQLPLMLNSNQMAALLGVDIRTMKQFVAEHPDSPVFRVGNRGQYRAPRDEFLSWLDRLSTTKQEQPA